MVKEEGASNSGFNKWAYKYDQENDCYCCPVGHKLTARGGIQKRKDRFAYVYQCRVSICNACTHRLKCSRSRDGRSITRYTDESWVESYREKMHRPREKALLRRRKAIVEHIFGVLKCWMGKIPLLLRGRNKVQIEIDLYTTAYNLKRLIKLIGFDGAKNMIMAKWGWKEGILSSLLAVLVPM